MVRHASFDESPPVVPGLRDNEEVWCVVRSTTDVLVGTDRRIFRVRSDGVDEWPYEVVDGIYPVGPTGVYVVGAESESIAIAIPDGPDHEESVQALTVMNLLVSLARRAREAPGGPITH